MLRRTRKSEVRVRRRKPRRRRKKSMKRKRHLRRQRKNLILSPLRRQLKRKTRKQEGKKGLIGCEA